ncbi:Pre-rRNA-processing protein fhl1 [Microbotryomycetes sp. JL201]|nr:Pre-rRNA-processing protein fhl1 [Microbotryomycetes sp. JL201]
MGSPDARIHGNASLPSFPLMDEEQPQRGEDDEAMLSSWARSLSPRMLPTTYGNDAGTGQSPSTSIGHQNMLDGQAFGSSGYRGIAGDSPVLAPLRRNQLMVGTGLSPELVPTRIGAANSPSIVSTASMMASGQAYDFSSFSSAFQATPPSDTLFVNEHSPRNASQPQTLINAMPGSSTHKPSPLNPFSRSLPPLPATSAASIAPEASTAPIMLTNPPATQIHGGPKTDEDPRIRAYAKLEFPSFDIFIQKLSVIIGRRPAAAALAAAASMAAAQSAAPQAPGSRPSLDASAKTEEQARRPQSEEAAADANAIKFEDYLQAERGASREPELAAHVKQEDHGNASLDVTVPKVSVTPSSPLRAVEDDKVAESFAEFIQSSPAVEPTVVKTAKAPSVPPASTAPELSATEQGPVGSRFPEAQSTVVGPSEPTAPAQSSSSVKNVAVVEDSSVVPAGFLTDIDLGPIRAVSRQHARLFYDYDTGSWAIEVLGRNGLVVDGKWTAKGEKEILGARSKIQIAERIFYFVLPSSDAAGASQQAGVEEHAESPISDLSESQNESSSLSELSDSEVELSPVQSAVDDGQLQGVPPIKPAQARRSANGKGKGKGKMFPPPRTRRRSSVSETAENWRDGEEDEYLPVVDEDDLDDSYVASLPRGFREGDKARQLRSNGPDLGRKAVPGKGLPTSSQASSRMRRRSDAQPEPRMYGKSPASHTASKMPSKHPRKQPRQAQSRTHDTSALFDPSALPPLPDLSVLPPLPSIPALPETTPSVSPAPAPASASPVGALPPLQAPNLEQPQTISPSALKAPAAASNTLLSEAAVRLPELGAQPVQASAPQAAVEASSEAITTKAPSQSPSLARPSPATAPTVARPSPYTPAPHPPGAPYPDRAPDSDRQKKPPYTYASLVAQAIMDSAAKRLTLTAICEWVEERWPYFQSNQPGWQNSIRHNLSLARGFIKLPRKADEPGKGSFWALDPASMEAFDGHNYRKKIVKNPPATSSALKSSAAPMTSATAPASARPATAAATPPAGRALRPAQKIIPPKRTPVPVARPVGKAGAAASPASSSLSQPMPIVVSPLPDSYVRPPIPPSNGNPPDELTIALLKDPPIILHEGKLILNPGIFSHLEREQINNLQSLPASNALQILQTYVVQHFKDKMKKSAQEKANARAGPPQPNGTPRPSQQAASASHGSKSASGNVLGSASLPALPGSLGTPHPSQSTNGAQQVAGKSIQTIPAQPQNLASGHKRKLSTSGDDSAPSKAVKGNQT